MGFRSNQEGVLEDIRIERRRQDEKWGPDRELSDPHWLTILMEEVGEVAMTLLDEPEKGHPACLTNKELIQVAAVVVAWMESRAVQGEGAAAWVHDDDRVAFLAAYNKTFDAAMRVERKRK